MTAVPEPAGTNCADGGYKITSGLDTDSDGILQASEVTSTNYVCNGSNGTNGINGTNGVNGLNTLMAVVPESAGTNCADGGLKITSGLDTDSDGVLQASEVTSTNYACNGTNGTNGANGLNTLVAVVSEPAGANCADGGYKLTSGLDTNSDSTLQASEVTSTNYVCNGANGTNGTNGLNTLMATVPEAPGANCLAGGLKITSGLDTDSDGILQASEVTSTNYVCNGSNGTNGTNGANGLNTLMATAAEPADANCLAGGLKITSGLDTNGDGILQPSEVTSTSYVCNGLEGPPGTGIPWVDVTGTSVQAVSNTGYIANSPSQVTITLPASPTEGDIVRVTGAGAGGWKIAQNAGQSIAFPGEFGAIWIRTSAPSKSWQSVASSSDGTKLVAAVSSGGIYTSINSGATWTQTSAPTESWESVASSSDGTKLVAVVYGGGIYTSADSGATWTQTTAPTEYWQSVASSSDGTKLVAVVLVSGGIYTSTDSGATWTQTSAPNASWTSVASSSDGTKLVAANSSGIYTSTDSGATWTQTTAPSLSWQSVASSSDGTKLVAASNGSGIYTSADSGATWIQTNAPINQEFTSVASSSDGTRLIAVATTGVSTGGIYASINSGATWVQTSAPTSEQWRSVAMSSDGIKVAAAVSGLYIYTFRFSTTAGIAGSLSGWQYDSIELQYIAGVFMPISYVGDDFLIQ